MRVRSAVVSAAVLAALAVPASAQERTVVDVASAAEFQRALSGPLENTTIRLWPGEYHLESSAGVDSTCGNCEDPNQTVPITIGQRVSGRSVWIQGPEGGGAVVYTNAGYGLFFEDCTDCRLENVVVTGGERDPAKEATDAAVVVKRGKVLIQGCEIRDNIGAPEVLKKNVVGIMGICGREGSDVTVTRCRIIRNSWDGIALYRDANARIFYNVIDGVDQAKGSEAGGGRGVGIGVTWNATARIERNLVRRYWKGVGIFVDAKVQLVENIIEEMLTWGIAYWDAGKGRPSAAIGSNVVYDCGACGVSITREAPLGAGEYASLTQNAIGKTGQNPKYDDPESYCRQCALAIESAPEGLRVSGNVFYDNRRASDDLPDYDIPRDRFRRAIDTLVGRIVGPVDSYGAQHVFKESTFLREFSQ
jgi:hypothetical protein